MSKCLAALILAVAFTLIVTILKGIGSWLMSLAKRNPTNQAPKASAENKALEDKPHVPGQGQGQGQGDQSE